MTGRQAFDAALQLAANDALFETGCGNTALWRRRALAAVNAVYAELFGMEHPDELFVPLSDMQQTLHLCEKTVCFVMPYGILMHLCAADADTADGARYTALYNRRRATVAAPAAVRRDVLPRGYLL